MAKNYDRQGFRSGRGRGPGMAQGQSPWRIGLAALLVLAVAALAVVAPWRRTQAVAGTMPVPDAGQLAAYQLAGPRADEPLNIVILVDFSGSFDDFASFRQTALDRVLEWAPGNLRDDDLITVIAFATSARRVFGPAAVADLGTQPVTLTSYGIGGGTAIMPALQQAAGAAPAGMATALIALTDTIIEFITAADTEPYLAQMNATTVSVIEPKGIGVCGQWNDSFPDTAAFEADPDDADATALAVGQALAHATGQTLSAV